MKPTLYRKKLFLMPGCLLLSAALLLQSSSCGLRTDATALSAGYSRKAIEQGEADEAFVAALSDFSFSLFRESLQKDGSNDLLSPLSATVCLAMLANGTAGSTETELGKALGMSRDSLNKGMYGYLSTLYSAKSCKLQLADSIWIRDSEADSIRKEFLQANADWYDASVYSAPFDSSTVKDINKWVNRQSDGMIDSILDSIPDSTVMYLINALAFDAKWETKYRKSQIRDGQFIGYDGTETTASMMYSEESVFLSGEGVQGFAKNYAGGRYSFVALLPDRGSDIYTYAASLDGKQWQTLWKNKTEETVRVAIPEFRCERQRSLKESLAGLGVTKLFEEQLADFSALSSTASLHCSEITQKVFLEVDRNGTKAAAITRAGVNKAALNPEEKIVTLDRPFLYAVADNRTGLPLFLGITAAL